MMILGLGLMLLTLGFKKVGLIDDDSRIRIDALDVRL